jgi:F-type H+-transporting ATPase subunit b
MPQLDFATYAPQLVWLAITFVALYLILARVALPRVAEVLEERQQRIADDLDQAEKLKADAEKVLADYEAALSSARSKSMAIAAEMHEKVASETADRKAEVEADLAKKAKEAEAGINAARSEAMSHVREVAEEAARGVVAKLTGNEPDAQALAAALDASSAGGE